ncbi:MAG TPA: 30S ribosomal protein S17, partial [Planctomycetaceae bacterium]|nr:30S ribosomal protein S17 [Planctomycetaceae bacterium]
MKKRLTGVVTSDKADKTLRVEIERRYRHSMYG